MVQEPLYTYLEPCTSDKLDRCMEDLREATARFIFGILYTIWSIGIVALKHKQLYMNKTYKIK